MTRTIIRTSAIAALLTAGLATAAAAETTLRAVTGLPGNNPRAKAFVQFFVKTVNADNPGKLQIKYLGGPEVVPSSKAAAALKRGVMDILYSPIAYYSGQMPEGHALEVSNAPREEIRANGGMAMLNKIWNERLNAEIIGWGSYGTQYNVYLTQKPKFGADGLPDLSGLRLRSNETYKPIIVGLHGTPVEISISEIYTALQRGVVQGFCFPNSGLLALGVERMVKYRIDPSFYRGANLVIVNLDKWKSLTEAERKALRAGVSKYEKEDDVFVAKLAADEAKVMRKNGLQIVTLKGDAAKKYLKIAYEGLWDRVADRSKHAADLRKKLYKAE